MALLLSSATCTVTSIDDALLKINTTCTDPSLSPTLYIDWLKDIVATNKTNKASYKQLQISRKIFID